MQVQNFFAACPLVQIIHILGNDIYIELALQLSDKLVGRIWLCGHDLAPALIIKVKHQFTVPFPGIKSCYVLNPVFFPQASGIPESFNAAFSADSSTRKNNQSLFWHFITNSLLRTSGFLNRYASGLIPR